MSICQLQAQAERAEVATADEEHESVTDILGPISDSSPSKGKEYQCDKAEL